MIRRRALTLRFAGSALIVASTLAFPSSLIAQRDTKKPAALTVSDSWNAVVMDFAVSRRMVDRAGQAIGVGPQTARYHLDASPAPLGWRTRLTISPARQLRGRWDGTVSDDDPIGDIRVEDDGDGSPLRLYNRIGHPIHLPSAEAIARLTGGVPPLGAIERSPFASEPVRPARFGRDWVAQMIASRPERGNRVRALERAFGRPAGRVSALDRYLKQEPDRTIEILADPDTGVVREARVNARGARVFTMSTTYREGTDGTLVKDRVHIERAVGGERPATAIADLAVTDLRFERR